MRSALDIFFLNLRSNGLVSTNIQVTGSVLDGSKFQKALSRLTGAMAHVTADRSPPLPSLAPTLSVLFCTVMVTADLLRQANAILHARD
jgi:hypothetical protein